MMLMTTEMKLKKLRKLRRLQMYVNQVRQRLINIT